MKNRLAAKTKEINKILAPFYIAPKGSEALLSDAMEYSLTSGGKRLRPLVMREAALLFGEEPEALPYFMAAMEMIHNFSLIHDDLPSMDNDLMRHGKPSTHAVYGEAQAVLAGDALLSLAFETVTEYGKTHPEKEIFEAAFILSKATGSRGMCGGQALDVSLEKKGVTADKDQIRTIYELKTGKLFSASLKIGGVLAKAKEREVKTLEKIGDCVGFAFQITDDLLDIRGDEKLLGKPVGSDEKNDKNTYTAAFGVEKSEKKVRELTEEAIESLMTLPGDKTFLNDLFLYLMQRDM